jgi:hypothetical protein
MANRSVTVYVDDDAGSVQALGGGSSGSRLTMEAGDVLTVYHNPVLGDGGTITVSGFATTRFTSASNMSLYPSNSQSRTVKTSPTLGNVDITCAHSGVSSRIIYLSIISSEDNTPDAFTFDSVTDANPSQEYALGSFTVTGINVNVTAVASGTAGTKTSLTLGGTPTTANKTVANNQVIYVYGTSSATYGASTSATVTINTVSHTSTIANIADPSAGTRIPLGITSGTISLDNIRKLFGPATYGPIYGTAAMNTYYRNGTYVPNITSGTPNNNNIPTSGVIDLADFYSCCTSLYYSSPPSNKVELVNTVSGAVTRTITFSTNDWTMGYGPDMKYLVEYRFINDIQIYTELSGGIATTAVLNGTSYNLETASDPITSPWSSNGVAAITCVANNESEAMVVVKLTIEARHKIYTSYTTSTEVTYRFNVFGP